MALAHPPASLLDDASLFLDLDGTLVEFALAPDGIEVCDQLRSLLIGLQKRLGGRVAVVSGRALADLDGHLNLPGLAIAGSHGVERRSAGGQLDSAETQPAIALAAAEAAQFADAHGLILESKPTGVALHYRLRPELESLVDGFARQSADRFGLAVQEGRMVRELRSLGRNKGDVVRMFMAEQPFREGRPVVIGDDRTDEDAFAVANAMGGASVLVGPERETEAKFRLPDVSAVKRWLGAVA